MTGHTAHTGHTRALDTERESQVTHGDLDHGVRVHIYNVYYKLVIHGFVVSTFYYVHSNRNAKLWHKRPFFYKSYQTSEVVFSIFFD